MDGVGHSAIEQTVQEYFEAALAIDADAIARVFSPGSLWFNPLVEDPVEGPGGAFRFLQRLEREFGNLRRTARSVFVLDDAAAATWTGRGRGTDGREADVSGVDVVEVDPDGRIRSLWSYWDPGALTGSTDDGEARGTTGHPVPSNPKTPVQG